MPPKKRKPPQPTTTTNPPAQPPLSWPPLTPLIPASDLTLSTTLSGQILTIPNFFTSTLCKAYVSYLSKSAPLTTTPGVPKRGEAVRVNDRFQILDEGFAKRLWDETGLKEVLQRQVEEEEKGGIWGGEVVVGLNPNIRVYRYRKGQFFDKHYDDSTTLTLNNTPSKTTWTLLLYLTGVSDGIVGGETVFYTEATKHKKSEEIIVGLEKGMLVLHKHGRDCLLHEGRVVTDDAGLGKWVLRTDLVVGR